MIWGSWYMLWLFHLCPFFPSFKDTQSELRVQEPKQKNLVACSCRPYEYTVKRCMCVSELQICKWHFHCSPPSQAIIFRNENGDLKWMRGKHAMKSMCYVQLNILASMQNDGYLINLLQFLAQYASPLHKKQIANKI